MSRRKAIGGIRLVEVETKYHRGLEEMCLEESVRGGSAETKLRGDQWARPHMRGKKNNKKKIPRFS